VLADLLRTVLASTTVVTLMAFARYGNDLPVFFVELFCD
jgi:hypothetical protein